MYFLYVDESGDVGLECSPTRYFILSGFVVHELCWHQTLEEIIAFRKALRIRYGLKLREELHAAHFLHSPGVLSRIRKDLRLRIIRDVVDFESGMPDVNVINILVDKSTKSIGYDVFDNAWMAMIQRFENTISNHNFPGPQNPQDFGILVVDQTDEPKLRNLSRRLHRYNPVPSMGGGGYRQLPIRTLVEDPVHRNSLHSYFIQLADINAYCLLQREHPNSYFRKKGARNYFNRLDPILCKVASRKDPHGIVRL